ncbi:MAG: NADH-quinone oxidoreductase subunit N, partial [Candidatus Acidiferrales bacterium]
MWSEFFQPEDFRAIVPQLELTLFACGILLMDFLLERRHKYMNAITALLGVGFSGFEVVRLMGRDETIEAFNGMFVADSFFLYFSLVFLLATAVVILMSVAYLELEDENEGEYYALILFAAVGMMFLAGGFDLITLFVGLELMAISFYLLTGFLRRDRRSSEAALKYFLLGVFSTGVLAYGFSLLYGVSGSTNLERIGEAVRLRGLEDPVVFLALVAVAAGLFFKVAAVPFHQWAPDAYQGAPTPITAYISVGSKAASFALLLRLFLVPLVSLREHWEVLLTGVALATMTLGNLAAINQSNVKRLLAYSSIGHVGYILLGLVAGNDTGRIGIAVYIFAYAAMTLGAFAVVTGLRGPGRVGDTLDDMRGLFFKNPAPAVLMLVFLLSLT